MDTQIKKVDRKDMCADCYGFKKSEGKEGCVYENEACCPFFGAQALELEKEESHGSQRNSAVL